MHDDILMPFIILAAVVWMSIGAWELYLYISRCYSKLTKRKEK